MAEEGRESARDAASREAEMEEEAEIYAATGDRRQKREKEDSENSSGKKLLLTPFDPTRVDIPSPFKPPPQRRNVTPKALLYSRDAQQQRKADADYRKKAESNRKSAEESKRLSSLYRSNSASYEDPEQVPVSSLYRSNSASYDPPHTVGEPSLPLENPQGSKRGPAPNTKTIKTPRTGETDVYKEKEKLANAISSARSSVRRGGKLINKTKKYIKTNIKTKHRKQFRKTKHRKQFRKTKHRK